MTRSIVDMAKPLGVAVPDHIIVGKKIICRDQAAPQRVTFTSVPGAADPGPRFLACVSKPVSQVELRSLGTRYGQCIKV